MQSVNRLRSPTDVQLQTSLSKLIAEKQQEISSGRRIDKPSDDPCAWSQISEISMQQSNTSVWLGNVKRSQTIARQGEDAIGEINNQLIRTKELLIQANSDTISTEERSLIALEVEALEGSIAELINSKDSFGNDLFENGQPLEIPIDDNTKISVVPGRSAFTDLGPTLSNISDSIRNGDHNDRNAMLLELDNQLSTVTNLLGSQGIIGNRLEQAASHLNDRQLDLTIFRSAIEDADISQSIISMQSLLVNLQAAQATYAQIQQASLFDALR